jgi:lysophospholipase L1-like esterase
MPRSLSHSALVFVCLVCAAGSACGVAARPPAVSTETEASSTQGVAGELSEAPEPAAALPPPPIPPGTAVLHIGDSFALAGFAQGLKPHMKALKARYEVRSEQSSYTNGWAAKLEKIVADTQPDLVIINLGANEVDNPAPETRAPSVRRISALVSGRGRPCVWVSPPSWKKDTGIVEVIRKNSAPCRFFDSDKQVSQPIPRQKDKIHPSEEGGKQWADAFWGWLDSQRAPAAPTAEGAGKASPWALLPAPPEEHGP